MMSRTMVVAQLAKRPRRRRVEDGAVLGEGGVDLACDGSARSPISTSRRLGHIPAGVAASREGLADTGRAEAETDVAMLAHGVGELGEAAVLLCRDERARALAAVTGRPPRRAAARRGGRRYRTLGSPGRGLLIVARQEVRHPRHALVDRGAQGSTVRAPRRLDVLQRHDLAGVLLAHRPAEEAVAVEDPNLGQVARVVADSDSLADIGRESRMAVAEPWKRMPSRRTTRGLACRTSRRSRSSRVSGRRGRKPWPRQAASGVWLDLAVDAAMIRAGDEGGERPVELGQRQAGGSCGLAVVRCPGSSGSSSVLSVPNRRSILPRPCGRATAE